MYKKAILRQFTFNAYQPQNSPQNDNLHCSDGKRNAFFEFVYCQRSRNYGLF